MACTQSPWKIEKCDASNIADWYDLVSMTFLTPSTGKDQAFLDVFYPKGITPAIRQWQLSDHGKSVTEPDGHYFIIRDQSKPGSPCVAGARWQVVKAKTAADFDAEEVEAAKEREQDAKIPDVRFDRFEVFRVAQRKSRWEHLHGRPYIYLRVIATHPEYQRKGLGMELMKWGMRKADEMGIESYLEASDAGKGLYEKCGFEVTGLLDWDATRFEGIRYPFTNYAMVRKPGQGAIKY